MYSGNLPLIAAKPNRKKHHEVAASIIKEPENRCSPLGNDHEMVARAITPAAARAPHMVRCHFGIVAAIK